MRDVARALLLVAAAAGVAAAQPTPAPPKPAGPAPAPAPAAPPARVAVVPLATLGSEASSGAMRTLQADLAAAVASVPGMTVVPGRDLARAMRDARRPELRGCDGGPECLADLGGLVSARFVVYGEVGGLGAAQVVFLKVVDVAARQELRSTTLTLGGDGPPGADAHAAAVRLLAPGRYVGRLDLAIDVAGATVFVDGDRVAWKPGAPVELAVGTHALRVTHRAYRDFVRFVDVDFEAAVSVRAELQQFPIVSRDMRAQGGGVLPLGPVVPAGPAGPPPWYRRWYTVAGFGAVLLVGSALAVGYAADGIDFDREETVE